MTTERYLIALLICIANAASFGQTLDKQIASDYAYLESLYLHLHQHPELSFYEKNTSRRMAEELRQLGFEVTENVGGYGVVAVLQNGKGPTVLVRADMDALPVAEETGKPYASKVTTTDESGRTVGVMHACGHDVHMTAWVGAARALAALKQQWKGTLVFIAQPAEERSGGAKAMLAGGLYEKFPLPDYALAIHVSASLPAGAVGICSGYTMANVDMVDITVYGRGGHGAAPHTTIDPVVLAARLILDFQTIVSREINPTEPAVLTVVAITFNNKGNVIPNEVKMELTLRSYADEVRNAMIEKIQRICRGVAASAGLPENMYPKVEVRNESTPSLYNDPALAERIGRLFKTVLGEQRVHQVSQVMTGEDFGQYGRTAHKVPILLYWLGAVDPALLAAAERGEAPYPSLHNSRFAPLPEPTIKAGVMTMTAAVMELMK